MEAALAQLVQMSHALLVPPAATLISASHVRMPVQKLGSRLVSSLGYCTGSRAEREQVAVVGALLYTALAPDRLLVGFLFVEAQNGQEMVEEDQVRYTRTVAIALTR